MRICARVSWLILIAMLSGWARLCAQSTVFAYQGQLTDRTFPGHGLYDFRFELFDANGVQKGPTLFRTSVGVVGGRFAVDLDFGDGFTSESRWLQVGVRGNGGVDYATLSPRQALTTAPYAVRATRVSTVDYAAVEAIQGVLPLSVLPSVVVTDGESGVSLSGSFSGDGGGLTGVKLSSLKTGGMHKWGAFTRIESMNVGAAPSAVTVADVNGDGRTDVITANLIGDSLTVLINAGQGRFSVSTSPSVGNAPSAIAAADVNGDGKVDLISANLVADSLSVLTNDGSGSFVLSSSPAVGNAPNSVIAVDVNGDGKVDLVSANEGANSLSVLTNDGSGGFVLSSSPSAGFRPNSVGAADLNSDGAVDLVSASAMDAVTVLLNDGAGGFLAAASPSVGAGARAVTTGDVNGDGAVDVITANLFDDTLTVLINDGQGGWSEVLSPSVGSTPYSVQLADVNLDGRIDLITANAYEGTLSVMINRGGGEFIASTTPKVGIDPKSIAVADANEDGVVDLVVANQSESKVAFVLNSPIISGAFSGSGIELTELNGSRFTSGTMPDTRLSSDIASRTSGNTFEGNQTIADGKLTVRRSYQYLERMRLIGREWGGERADSVDGISFWLGLNFSDNRQLWIVDSARMGQNTTSPALRIEPRSGAPLIQARSIDDTTPLSMGLGPNGLIHVGALGYVGIGTSSPAAKLHVAGGVTCTVLTQISDRRMKDDLAPVSTSEALEKVVLLPLSTWTFKEGGGGRHLGPMAQDFYAAFGLGDSESRIALVDSDGVILAAIQGLAQKAAGKRSDVRSRIQQLESENAELGSRLENLERLIEAKKRRRVK